MEIKIRPAVSSDSAACGRVIAAALQSSSNNHGAWAEMGENQASSLAAGMLDHPEMYGLVAEVENRIAGTVFLDERAIVRGVGWLSVEPQFQGRGIGRLMMNEVIERSLTSPGMRSVVDEKNAGAIALLSSLRFEAKEPLTLLRGRLNDSPAPGIEVRAMTGDDVEACGALSEQAHGFGRESELRNAIEAGTALVAIRKDRITGYATDLACWHAGHAVGEKDEELRALVTAAAAKWTNLSFLVPHRRADLLTWCLAQGLVIERSMLLMTLGEYQDPACIWLPSAMF